MENNITSLIRKIRDIFPPQVDASWVGKNGKCYQVALVLKHIFPQAEIHYSDIEGHVYTLIDGVYYDIDGMHLKVPEDTCLLDHRRGHKPHRWHLSFKNIPVENWLRR
ncbi:hypothetical protein [Salmonella phage SSE121]|uniref:Uncharacterized protein n=1 Tax=Salmonella phage SSE121 TaxID=1204529 RepID=K4IEV9_9CAUD|nr:hypothetical protein ACQ19_gp148 [Salmonella phage SSE121]AFU63789.1 hypothetical protein [Salmonella phage SSE121]